MSDAKAPTPPADDDSILGRPRNWIDVDEVVKIIHAARNASQCIPNKPKWNWFWNTRCKYINLRIDMRDGHCLIFDRDNNSITLEQLQYQLRQEKD